MLGVGPGFCYDRREYFLDITKEKLKNQISKIGEFSKVKSNTPVTIGYGRKNKKSHGAHLDYEKFVRF